MRLYNIYYICNVAVDNIQFMTLKLTNQNTYKIHKWQDALNSLELLRNIPFLVNDIDKVIETVPLYIRDAEEPEIDGKNCRKLDTTTRDLLSKLRAIIDLYEFIGNGESQEGIDIKIPKCDSLKEYIQYMKDIDFVLSQCPFISKCNEEEIVFNTVDVGSMWISLVVKATAAKHLILNTISKMLELAIKVKSNNIILKQQNEMLETMRQKNEIGQEVIDTFKFMKTKMLDEVVTELEQSSEISIENPEERDRAGRTLSKLAELLEKGVEIYSTIETPNEIKVLFPFTDNSPTIPDNLLKMIEDKEIKEDEE